MTSGDHWDLDGQFYGYVEGSPLNFYWRMKFTKNGTVWVATRQPEGYAPEDAMTYIGADSRHRAQRLINQLRQLANDPVRLYDRAADPDQETSKTASITFLDVGPASDRQDATAGTTEPPHPVSQDQTG